MGMADAERGRAKHAVATLHHAVTLSGGTVISLAALARAHALNHEPDSARAIVDSLEQRALAGYAPRYELAKVYLALGNRTAALAALVRARQQREHSMVFLAIDPQFEALRKDPAFAALTAVVEGG